MKSAYCFVAVMMTMTCLCESGCVAGTREYLTPRDFLAERVEVRELRGGVAGFTGIYCSIEPDGAWSAGPLLPPAGRKGTPSDKGKADRNSLKRLAGEFERSDLAGLPNYGRPLANPLVFKVFFGGRVSELMPGRDAAPSAEDRSIRERYRSIVRVVMEQCGKKAD
jgi:hypothetical protein